jgi:hypothetical protein
VSLGGKVVLINSVLASIPIFLPLFFQVAIRCSERNYPSPKEFLMGYFRLRRE